MTERRFESIDPVLTADTYGALFKRVLPAEAVSAAAASALAADLADVLAMSTKVHNALSVLDSDTSDLDDVLASLNVVHQEFVVHAPFHVKSLSGYLTDLIVRLEETSE